MTELGKRIRLARQAARLNQRELAERVGVATQTVTQWEQGSHSPRRDRIVDIARHTNVSLSWLLTGFPLPVQASDGTLVFHELGKGNTVPLIDIDDAVRRLINPGDHISDTAQRIPTVYPCSPRSFAIAMPDRSGLPVYEPGDRMVFDPAIKAEPGDVVLAAAGPKRTPIIGRLSYETGARGAPVTVVTPLNSLFAPARSSHHYKIDIRAVLSEHTHKAR